MNKQRSAFLMQRKTEAIFSSCMSTDGVNVTAGGSLMNEEVREKARQWPYIMTGSIG